MPPHSGPLLNRPERVTRSKGLREPYEAGARPSVGSVGDAYDDAMCESVFATLEFELLVSLPPPHTGRRRAPRIFDFIEGWYKPRRR